MTDTSTFDFQRQTHKGVLQLRFAVRSGMAVIQAYNTDSESWTDGDIVSGVWEQQGIIAALARINALENELRRLQDVVGEEDYKLIETLLAREPQL